MLLFANCSRLPEQMGRQNLAYSVVLLKKIYTQGFRPGVIWRLSLFSCWFSPCCKGSFPSSTGFPPPQNSKSTRARQIDLRFEGYRFVSRETVQWTLNKLTKLIYFIFHTCGVVLTILTHSSLGVTRVSMVITLACHARHVRSSIRCDTCESAGTLFTELAFVLWWAWTCLHIGGIFCIVDYTGPENFIDVHMEKCYKTK